MDLSVGFGFLLNTLLLLMASSKLSLFASVLLDLLDYLPLVEAQIIIDFTLAITAFGF